MSDVARVSDVARMS